MNHVGRSLYFLLSYCGSYRLTDIQQTCKSRKCKKPIRLSTFSNDLAMWRKELTAKQKTWHVAWPQSPCNASRLSSVLYCTAVSDINAICLAPVGDPLTPPQHDVKHLEKYKGVDETSIYDCGQAAGGWILYIISKIKRQAVLCYCLGGASWREWWWYECFSPHLLTSQNNADTPAMISLTV